jgi:CBS domain containing-hemolysin-like protein
MSTLAFLSSLNSHAAMSVLEGAALDQLAEVLSWVVLVIVPVVGIVVFWLLHILPEKIAEKRHHPQTAAIQMLCLLSLFFGGLLWPLAWLWAYSKPVLYKMAYGTDVVRHGHDEKDGSPDGAVPDEITRLRERLDALSRKSPTESELQEAARDVASLEAQLKPETARGGAI